MPDRVDLRLNRSDGEKTEQPYIEPVDQENKSDRVLRTAIRFELNRPRFGAFAMEGVGARETGLPAIGGFDRAFGAAFGSAALGAGEVGVGFKGTRTTGAVGVTRIDASDGIGEKLLMLVAVAPAGRLLL